MNRQFWNSLQEMPRKSGGAGGQGWVVLWNLPKVRESPIGKGPWGRSGSSLRSDSWHWRGAGGEGEKVGSSEAGLQRQKTSSDRAE